MIRSNPSHSCLTKKITFEIAYRISILQDFNIKYLTAGMKKRPTVIIDIYELKKLPQKILKDQVKYAQGQKGESQKH